MKYIYEDLSPKQFEALVVLLCQKLLGMGVQRFSDGVDGGRDARFHGTAQLIPSAASPWNGAVIIQAKHTYGYNRHFSDSDFFSESSKSAVLVAEIPRIRRLREDGQLDHYMLFSNRLLGANTEQKIRDYIAQTCGIPASSILLVGSEQLELYMLNYPEIPGQAQLDLRDSPLIISPDELAEFVLEFATQRESIVEAVGQPPVARVSYESKNKVNKMTAQYAREQRQRFLKDTGLIQSFLAAPENVDLLELYNGVVEEFQLKILAKRESFNTFDQVLEHIFEILTGRSEILRRNKRLTRAILFYMYWSCDIGETGDAEAK